MARFRLINCEFVNASSFKNNISNKAQLLYLKMITSADDYGFVDSTKELINSLTSNEKEFNNTISLDLLENSYNSALNDLIDKGLVYEFIDNHKNKVHLIRHWFYHNKYGKGMWTNYKNFMEQVYLEKNEYLLGKKPLKENKTKETKPIQTNTNETNIKELLDKVEPTDDIDEEEVDKLLNEFKER